MSTETPTDAARFVEEQHQLIRDLFATVERTTGNERRDAFEPLVRLLAVHETAEEMVIYPTIRTADGGEAVAAARMQEEDAAKKQLTDLERLDPSTAEFDALFAEVRAAVEAHAEAEEREVLPLLRAVADGEQLERLGRALRAAEGIAPTHPHKLAPESALGNAVVGPFVAVVDRARDLLRDAMR